mmetsp:Transcript_11829/g.10453  ORF Transcript_11829/g.10453 Transcript_11829/m.10453 type:complete len:190 (+) Transcript_11829:121-690(+)
MVEFKTQNQSFSIPQSENLFMNSSFMTEGQDFVPETKKMKKIIEVIHHLDNYEIIRSLNILEKIKIKHKKVHKMVLYLKDLKRLVKARDNIQQQNEILKHLNKLEMSILIPKGMKFSSICKANKLNFQKFSPPFSPIVVPRIMEKRNSLTRKVKKKRINWLKEALEKQKEIYKQIDVPRYAMHRNSCII